MGSVEVQHFWRPEHIKYLIGWDDLESSPGQLSQYDNDTFSQAWLDQGCRQTLSKTNVYAFPLGCRLHANDHT